MYFYKLAVVILGIVTLFNVMALPFPGSSDAEDRSIETGVNSTSFAKSGSVSPPDSASVYIPPYCPEESIKPDGTCCEKNQIYIDEDGECADPWN